MGNLAVIDQPQTGLAMSSNVEIWRASTDAASMCKDIVVKRAINLQGKRYVPVEGWQAIALAHGCVASAENVRRVDGGVAADGVIRRMADGAEVARAEGFVGEDEPTWFGGKTNSGKVLPRRPEFAIRAMAQTRAVSRACRSAFAHVVIMMDVGLETTPFEEMQGVYDNQEHMQPARTARKEADAKVEAAALPDPSGHEQLRAKAEGWVRDHTAAVEACDSLEALDAVIAKGKAAVEKLNRDHADLRDLVMDAYSAKGEALEAAIAQQGATADAGDWVEAD